MEIRTIEIDFDKGIFKINGIQIENQTECASTNSEMQNSVNTAPRQIQFDYRKLKGKIKEIFGSQTKFSQAMGWSERTLSLKMNSKVFWRQSEIRRAVTLLRLSDGDIPEYFFKEKQLELQEVRG